MARHRHNPSANDFAVGLLIHRPARRAVGRVRRAAAEELFFLETARTAARCDEFARPREQLRAGIQAGMRVVPFVPPAFIPRPRPDGRMTGVWPGAPQGWPLRSAVGATGKTRCDCDRGAVQKRESASHRKLPKSGRRMKTCGNSATTAGSIGGGMVAERRNAG